MEGLFYVVMLLAVVGAFFLGGYGLLKLGHLINVGLQKKHDLRWIICVAAVLGFGLLVANFFVDVNGEWTRSFGVLLLVLVAVTLIIYKGR